MSKDEFLRELSELLSDLPEVEREEALEFYGDYLEDIGDDAEAMLQIGSPEVVAQRVKAGLAGNPEELIEYTEYGYKDQFDEQEKAQLTPKARRRAPASDMGEDEMWEAERGDRRKSGRSRRWIIIAALVLIIFLANKISGSVIRMLRAKNHSGAVPVSYAGEHFETSSFTTMHIEVNAGNVEVLMDAHGAGITVCGHHGVDTSLGGGVLNIECDGSGLFSFFESDTVQIIVPNETIENLEIEVNAGNVTLDHVIAEGLDVEVNAGNVSSEGLLIRDHAKVETNAGNVELKLLGNETSYNYLVDVSLGNVIINGNSYAKLSDKFRIQNDGAYRSIVLTANMGNIQVETD